MANIMIIYGGRHGQTRKVAARIAERLREKKHFVELYDALIRILPAAVHRADAILVGSSVHLGKHQPEVREFVAQYREILSQKPSAFFTVCMTAAKDTPDARVRIKTSLDHFRTETGWDPAQIGVFAGALRYRSYGFVLRWVMKQISKREGHATDTSRDHEYTDWKQVDAFTHVFEERLNGRPNLVKLTPSPALTYA